MAGGVVAAVEVFANQPTTTVSSGGTTAPSPGTVENWTVASSSGFQAAVTGISQFHVTDTASGKISEIIAVTNVSGTTWTVTRGAESTTPVAHTAGFTIQQVVTAGFLSSIPPNLQLVYVDQYGADSSGATDSTLAIGRARTALGTAAGNLVFGVGSYQWGTIATLQQNQGIIGQGQQATQFTYTGGSAAIPVFLNGSFTGADNAGKFTGFSLSGYSAGTAAVGLQYGDLQRIFVDDVSINGFGRAGIYGKNVAGWSEQSQIRAKLVQNGAGIYFDTSSFDYSAYELLADANPNQDGMRLENGAQLVGTYIGLRGNFHAGTANTGAAIAMDRLNTGTGTCAITETDFDVAVECDGTGGQTGHFSILQLGGNGSTQFTGQGVLSFISGGTDSFQGANFTGQYGFSGHVQIPGLGAMDPNDALVVQGASQWFQSGNTSSNFAYNGMLIYPSSGDYQEYILPNGTITVGGFFGGTANYERTRRYEIMFKQPSGGAAGVIIWPTGAGGVKWAGGTHALSAASNAIDKVRLTYYPGDNVWYGEVLLAYS